ncbi:MAG: 4'-phosphopantetheinyl transferase superfamily protein [Bacteroides sp.]|nr:4'-phosphopantetheinyl transferase superfamily protein [Bacteroides sp.]
MGLWLKQEGEDYCLGVWKIEETPEELFSLLPRNSVYEEQIARIHSAHRKTEWLAVRVLLSVLTDEHTHIRYYPSGRPYLNDGSWHISISHTRGYVAVLLSRHFRPGIDMEQYGTRIRKIAKRFMHTEEVVSLYQETDIWSLLLHWSAKEVMFKCLDTNGVDFAEHLRISPFKVLQTGQFDAVESRTQNKHRFIISYYLSPDFVMTWSFMEETC